MLNGVFEGMKRTFLDRFANETHHAHGATAIDESDAAGEHGFGEAECAVCECLLLWVAAATKEAQVLDFPLSFDFCCHVDKSSPL